MLALLLLSGTILNIEDIKEIKNSLCFHNDHCRSFSRKGQKEGSAHSADKEI